MILDSMSGRIVAFPAREPGSSGVEVEAEGSVESRDGRGVVTLPVNGGAESSACWGFGGALAKPSRISVPRHTSAL